MKRNVVEEDLVVVWVEVVMVERLEVVELQEATVVEEMAVPKPWPPCWSGE